MSEDYISFKRCAFPHGLVFPHFQLRNISNPILFDQVTRASLQRPAALYCIPTSRTIKLESIDGFSTSHIAHHPRPFQRPQRCLRVGSNHSTGSAPATAISQSRQTKSRAVLYLAPLVHVERISDWEESCGIARKCRCGSAFVLVLCDGIAG